MQTTGLIMGSGNLYSTTNNGYIIVVSGKTGEIKKLFKVSESFLTDLIISENKLFALTASSKLLLFKWKEKIMVLQKYHTKVSILG